MQLWCQKLGIKLTCEYLSTGSSGAAIVCLPQMTLYSATVTSLARFRLAQDAGVNLASLDLLFAVGKYGSRAIILPAEASPSGSEAHFWALVVIVLYTAAISRRYSGS
jgi:hypothetical protein